MNRSIRTRVGPAIIATTLLLASCSLVSTDDAGGVDLAPDGEPTTTAASTADPTNAVDTTTTSTTEAPATDGAGAQPDPVVWQPCGPRLECGSVTVPVDHDQPEGTTMELALVRRPADGTPRGSIFVNPGGPGASGIDYVRGGFTFDADTMAVYDLVGFDPRGIGQSAALGCDVDRSIGPLPDFSPDDEAEARLLDDDARAFAEGCAQAGGLLLEHLDTESVARDLDLARAAVGDDLLHYYGFSFGTLIGQVYAELFPERIGHLVLDGVVDPTASLTDLLTQQSIAFESAFAVLEAACADVLDCPDGSITATYDRQLAEIERSGPIGEVGPAEYEYAALVTLYSRDLWAVYLDALQRVDAADYSGIERLSDLFVTGVSFAAYAGVECTDSPRPDGPEEWDAFAAELAELAPRFGAAVANELRTCAFWPVEAGPRREPTQATGAPPIIVIGNTNDPATPLENAELVAAALDDGVLVVLEADRHTAYRASGCVADLVRDYFVDEVVPDATVFC